MPALGPIFCFLGELAKSPRHVESLLPSDKLTQSPAGAWLADHSGVSPHQGNRTDLQGKHPLVVLSPRAHASSQLPIIPIEPLQCPC